MPQIVVEDFLFDDENEEKLAYHGVSTKDVRAILDGRFRVQRNRNKGRASHMVVGYTRSGECLVVCIEPTHDPVIWRPVTGWYPTSHHQLVWCP